MTPAREQAIRDALGGGSWPCRLCGRRRRDQLDGDKVKALRLAAGLSQADLATGAAIHQGRLSEIERRLRPLPFEVAERLLEALGKDLP